MKISNVKAMLVKAAMVGVVAGAFAMVATAKAEAQGISVGVQFGRPAYGGGYYESRYDYYERLRFEQARREAFERQQAYLRHEQWEREHSFHGYYGRDWDRDRDHDRGDRDRGDHDRDGRRDWDRR